MLWLKLQRTGEEDLGMIRRLTKESVTLKKPKLYKVGRCGKSDLELRICICHVVGSSSPLTVITFEKMSSQGKGRRDRCILRQRQVYKQYWRLNLWIWKSEWDSRQQLSSRLRIYGIWIVPGLQRAYSNSSWLNRNMIECKSHLKSEQVSGKLCFRRPLLRQVHPVAIHAGEREEESGFMIEIKEDGCFRRLEPNFLKESISTGLSE